MTLGRRIVTELAITVGIIGAMAAMGLPQSAYAASLSFSPAAKTVSVGQSFTVTVSVDSPDQAMNTASGDISFPGNLLKILSVSKNNSIITMWVSDPSYSNGSGATLHFEGLVLNPGFTGSGGTVLQITFQAIAAGNASLSFSSGAVLANDGNGTNILDSLGTANIRITARSSALAPTVPALAASQIDVTPPAPFAITEITQDPTNPQPIFQWSTTDQGSGIAKYTVRIGNGDWFDSNIIAVTSTPVEYQLPLQAAGTNVPLLVNAYDRAGNVTQASTTFSIQPISPPRIDSYTNLIAANQPVFKIQGAVPSYLTERVTSVRIFLQKGSQTIAFQVPVDSNGNWYLNQEPSLDPGRWAVVVQAVDERGALSAMETGGTPITVGGWFDEAINFLIAWGAILLFAIVVTAAIVAIAWLLLHHLRRGRLSLSRRLIHERKELYDDLKRIKREMESGHGASIDLSAAAMRKKQELVERELRHLEEDFKKEDEKIGE